MLARAKSPPEIEVVFPPLHAGQEAVRRSPARFKVVVAGRRWRKTSLGVLICLESAIHGGRVWWVGPDYGRAAEGWRMLKTLAGQMPPALRLDIRESERMIRLRGRGEVQVRSADDPNSLRGAGLDGVVLDETAYCEPEAWYEALRPALSDREGWAMFPSTPNGSNWFEELYLKAQSEPGWAGWQFPSWTNPFLKPDEIAKARLDLPDAVFRQEYGAEFVAFAGQVFKPELVEACWVDARGLEPGRWACVHCGQEQTGTREQGLGPSACVRDGQPMQPRRYLTAYDLAKEQDWTVGLTLDVTERPAQIVAFERYHQVPWPEVARRMKTRFSAYPGRMRYDHTGLGQSFGGFLDVPAEPIDFTPARKTAMVTALLLCLERGFIRGPKTGDGIETLWRELKLYRWSDRDITQDTVMAAAMCAEVLHAREPGDLGIS